MMGEMVNLCLNLDINILGKKIVNIKKINASTLIGKGTLTGIFDEVNLKKLNLLICNSSLTPNQQRNLENFLKVKVVDRSGIIIEIFAKRALSNEGKLQVQLAEMIYRKSRLVRAWTHLERQRGGTSFVGGPGELQIELDRRLIQEKIDKIKKRLKNVSNRRKIQRKSRYKNNFKIFALVGYTNAGKTQLFNILTKKNQKSEDKLFATLDTKISRVYLNDKLTIGLIDTVGFINNIPTQLIESFKATFEEIHNADFIINVVDINEKNFKEKIENTIITLNEMSLDSKKVDNMITVYNKIDIQNKKPGIKNNRNYVSALMGTGITELKKILISKAI
jgi:GTP-binding protein HflX